VGAGLNHAVASRLHTASGAFFVKALSASARWVWTQNREAEIAPYVRPVAPELVGGINNADWQALIFEALPAPPKAHR
jgi:hypothetical protein